MDKINQFAKKRKVLFWDIGNVETTSEEVIVERILNYGDWDDVEELIKILGIKRVAEIFREQTSPKRMRCNYHKKTKNYFNLYFNKYALGNSYKRTNQTVTTA